MALLHSRTNLPCKFYANGSCKLGDSCSFQHRQVSAPHASAPHAGLLPTSQAPRPRPFCFFQANGNCKLGSSCGFQHTQEHAASIPHRNCTFYQQNRCTKGNACAFAHVPSDPVDIPSPKVPVFGAGSGKILFVPCKFFNQGMCTKGLACPFPHSHQRKSDATTGSWRQGTRASSVSSSIDSARMILKPVDPENLKKEETQLVVSPEKVLTTAAGTHPPVKSAPSSTSELIGSAKVYYGPGAAVEQIITPFESCRIVISGLPPDISQSELIDAVHRFGDLQKVIINKSLDFQLPSADVEFAKPGEAESAVNELSGAQYRRHTLQTHLDLRAVESGAATLRSSKVKVTWFAPSRLAWAHYSSISAARKAALRLNKSQFNGRIIQAEFQVPGARQSTSFSIIIKGLGLSVSSSSLSHFCEADSVTIGELAYEKSAGPGVVRKILAAYGTVEAFDVLEGDEANAKLKAFVQFTSADAAFEAVKALNGKPQQHLGKSPTYLEVVHSIKYTIPACGFAIIKDSIDAIRLESRGGGCTIRCYDFDAWGLAVDPVCIRMYSADAKDLGRAKYEMDRLMDGDIVQSGGEVIWDDYFQTDAGIAYLSSTSVAHGVYIRRDNRKRRLHIIGGSAESRNDAYAALVSKRAEIIAERHTMTLNKADLRQILVNLDQLHAIFGANKISLDLVSRTLNMRGTDEEIEEIKDAVDRIKDGADFALQSGAESAECPVCFCEPNHLVKMACGHAYCKECFAHYLKSVPETKKFPVRCIGNDGKCDYAIPVHMLREYLPPDSENRLYNAAYLAYIHQRPQEFRFCPTPDCQTIYRPRPAGTVLRCPSCLNRICPSCHVEFHEGQTCAEREDNADGGHRAYEKWRRENGVKACPNCKADIQKNQGCNHITCIRCRTHICWVCMKTFRDDGSDGGVYPHMQREHEGWSS